MTTPLFVINAQDAYAGTEGLALGTLAAHPEKPSVAHVVQGQVAVWANGQHGYYWKLQQATPAQIAAYDRAPRVAVAAQASVPEQATPSPATAPASAAAVVSALKPSAGGNGWDAVVAMAMQSGLMKPEELQAALPLLASGAKPAAPAGAAYNPQHDRTFGKSNVWDDVIAKFGGQPRTDASAKKPTAIDSAAIYAAHNTRQQPNAQDVWDNALAKADASRPQPRTAQVQRATLDPAAIYAQHNQPRTDAAALWDKAIASMQNPQRN